MTVNSGDDVAARRTPRGVRGLKRDTIFRIDSIVMSHHAWEAWMETNQVEEIDF